MIARFSVSLLFTATLCCYDCVEQRFTRIRSQRLCLPLPVSTHVPSNQPLQCVSILFSFNFGIQRIFCMLTMVIVFHGFTMLWQQLPSVPEICIPNRSVSLKFFLLMSSFSTIQETFTTSLLHCLPLFRTYFITKKLLNTSKQMPFKR